MKIKELNNLRTKEINELEKLLNKKIAEVMQVKVRIKVSKEKNLKHVKMLKQDVSQILTILMEKKLIKTDTIKGEGKENNI